MLNENCNGLLLYRDEISGFLKTIDREDRANDRAFYTQAFNGLGRYTYDRIERGTIDIENLCVAILGNIQPGVLRPYLSQAINGSSGDDGMLQRFQLIVWPDFKGTKPVDQWPDTAAKDKAYQVFARLAAWDGWDEPARFSDDAQLLFNDWYQELLIEIRANDIQPAIESHYGKYPSLVPSLASLIYLADDEYHNSVIGLDSVQKALAWIPYLKSHAERVYSSALDPVDANAQTILDKLIASKLLDGFGTGDIIRGGWTGLSTLVDVKAAIDRLVDYGWIKKIIPQPIAIGRPSERYSVHPIIFQKGTG